MSEDLRCSSKKIALVYDAIYPYVKGGGERRFYEIGKQLTAAGHEVHFYGMKFWDGPDVIEQEGMFLHGLCKARPLYVKDGRRSITQALLFGVSCFKLFRAKFDVIDCCGFPYFSLFTCRLVTLIRRKPLYATWHEVWGKAYWREYLGVLGRCGYAVERLAAKMPTQFIAVSDHTAELIAKVFKPHQAVHVIENGISTAEIEEAPPSKLGSDVIFAGRLVDFKHIDVLLEAISRIKHTMPDIKLAIVGDGPKRAELEQLSRRLGLEDNVGFIGFKPNHGSVIELMKSSKVLVLPSTREGFGIVAIEANAAGLPVITTTAPANAANRLIDGSNGVAVELNPSALAAAIETSLHGRYDRQYCIESARRYDWSVIAQKFEVLLT